MSASNSGMAAGVGFKRYFSTKAATPWAASALATSQPSLLIDRVRKPPPGATITAAPLPLPLAGRMGVSVATVTLRAKTLPYWRCQASGAVAPGNAPVPSSIAPVCDGIAIGVILSCCAIAGTAKPQVQTSVAADSMPFILRSKPRK